MGYHSVLQSLSTDIIVYDQPRYIAIAGLFGVHTTYTKKDSKCLIIFCCYQPTLLNTIFQLLDT